MHPISRRHSGGLLGALFGGGRTRRERDGMIAAIDRSQAVIEFAMDGTVLHANGNFLAAFGYRLDEVRGRHHRLFVDPADHDAPEYHALWARLRRGEFDAGQYRRIGKDGREVWVQASYNPVLDAGGRPVKVVKFATDITEQKRRAADVAGQLAAIDTSMAVVEFGLDGTIQRANANFLAAMGYAAHEIVGRHHSLFVDPEQRESAAYRAFWSKLGRGEYDAGQYRRLAKGGREVWIEASYNPILDPAGRPYKVVKFATDITAQKRRNADFEGQIAAIGKVQAVIEFSLSGEILDANANFLACVGYALHEIRGQHHRMFVPIEQQASGEYRAFWDRLGRGEADAGQYRRVGRDGREIWLQASYNPILGPDGRPYKVVKYATDVTAQVRLADSLKAMMGAINVYAGKISTASKEIAAGNSELSTRTEAQAANLEETASSMEELTSTVKRNADSARQANQLSIAAADVARRGGDVVQSVVATMQDIHASSRRIGDIIGVIDGIAFQTNILALNAAVEAARAGEQGRGFAVVASEVRSLAQRCADAAKDIKGLISQSGDKVAQGSARVEEAGRTMTEILGSIERVNAIMRDISAASEEQTNGIEQVNRAVMQMDQVTQQNAALVEEASAASCSLDAQAAALFDTVTGFVRDNGLGEAAEKVQARTPTQLRRVV